MPETNIPQRLGKAATTLNVSKDTIVEFLAAQGITVENNTMATIEPSVFELLLNEVSSDRKAKEKTAAGPTKIREPRETSSL